MSSADTKPFWTMESELEDLHNLCKLQALKLLGIDIAKKMIAKAKLKGVNNLFLSDARFLPFGDKTFDAAFCIHILHLIREWKTALGEVCRVTRGFLVSLLYTKKDPVRESYDQLLKKYGYERRRPGKSEQELKDLIVPTKSVFVSSYDTLADDRLINLAQGTCSSQWEIPKKVNQKVIEEVRSQFAGKIFTQELRILMWKIDDLKPYCEKVSI